MKNWPQLGTLRPEKNYPGRRAPNTAHRRCLRSKQIAKVTMSDAPSLRQLRSEAHHACAASVHWLDIRQSPRAVRAAEHSGDIGLDSSIAAVSNHRDKDSIGTFTEGRGKFGDNGVV